MNMGGRIAERLAELNWSQTDLVDRALQFCPDPDKPLTIKTLSAIIKRDNIASQWSEPIALALGVTHSWLVWGVGEKFPDGQDRHVPLPWPLFSVDPKQWAALPRSKKKKIDDFAHGVVAGHNSERAPGSGGVVGIQWVGSDPSRRRESPARVYRLDEWRQRDKVT